MWAKVGGFTRRVRINSMLCPSSWKRCTKLVACTPRSSARATRGGRRVAQRHARTTIPNFTEFPAPPGSGGTLLGPGQVGPDR